MPTLTLHHISAMYGVDANRDGIFDVLVPDSGEGPSGIIAAADGSTYGSGERRLGLVFKLSQIPPGSEILSAVLNLTLNSNQGGGNYELHGFANNSSVDLASLTVSHKLAGPFAHYVPFPIDVSGFIQHLLDGTQSYAGFSIRNVAPVGGIAFDGRVFQVRPDRAPSLEITFKEDSRISLVYLAREVRILFGVTNDGDGIGILPNGQIIRIPPRSPSAPLFQQIAKGITEVTRGLGVREIVLGSTIRAPSAAIGRQSLEMMAKALEEMLQAVRKELGEPSN